MVNHCKEKINDGQILVEDMPLNRASHELKGISVKVSQKFTQCNQPQGKAQSKLSEIQTSLWRKGKRGERWI